MSDYLYYDNHTKSWSQPLKKAEIERLFIEGKVHAKDWCSGPLPTKDYQRLENHPVLSKDIPLWQLMVEIQELWNLKRNALLRYLRDPNHQVKSLEVELQKRVDATIEKVLKLWRREGDVFDKEISWRTKGGAPFQFSFEGGLSYAEKREALHKWLQVKDIDDKPGSYLFFKEKMFSMWANPPI